MGRISGEARDRRCLQNHSDGKTELPRALLDHRRTFVHLRAGRWRGAVRAGLRLHLHVPNVKVNKKTFGFTSSPSNDSFQTDSHRLRRFLLRPDGRPDDLHDVRRERNLRGRRAERWQRQNLAKVDGQLRHEEVRRQVHADTQRQGFQERPRSVDDEILLELCRCRRRRVHRSGGGGAETSLQLAKQCGEERQID